ncbi:MAG: hypothetical protein WD181_00425 [Solirubrobacterales bacterium]
MSPDDREDAHQREIDELLRGEGGGSAGKRLDRDGGVENLPGKPSQGRFSTGRPRGSDRSAGVPPDPDTEPRATDPLDQARGPAAVNPPESQSAPNLSVNPRDKVKLPLNYGALVGILIAFVAVFILVNALRNTESGTVGIGPVGIGEKVDPFAVPIAVSDLEGDANVDPVEACRVTGEDVLRICDYFDRPLLVSFWFTGGASECIDQQDVFEQVAERFKGRAGAISINVRDDRRKVQDLVEERGWQVEVGHDTDGAVSNMYRIGGCPTFLFVRAGGVLEQAEIGRTTVEELSSQVRSFLNDQEAKEESGQKVSGR